MSDSDSSVESFRVDSDRQGGAAVLTVVGDLDLSTATVLQGAVDTARDENPDALIIDLTGVGFLASAGMSVLVNAHKTAQGHGIEFAVVATGAATARPLQLVGLDEILGLHGTLDSALADIGDGRAVSTERP